ncbi:MAG: ABC transporter permease [Cohaesibacter sp.]|jgi:putative hydroxymethylpyrimidine transport system permease protein|nr:ABC transporter permease [Cohaesibacter sp.]
MSMTKTLAVIARPLAATALILTLWQLLVSFGGIPSFILPGPMKVIETLWDSRELIATHALVTTWEVLLGLVLGTLLGAMTAIQLATSAVARYLIKPVLILTQALPVFALAPLLTLWLGYGISSKILMAVLIIYFPVASSFFDGLMQTPKGWLDLGHVMNGSDKQILWRIRLPAAIPSFASGLRLAAVYAPIGAVIGEWVGASQGLGYLMLLANGRAKISLMFAALFVLALLTLLLHIGVSKLCDRLVARYR